MGEVPAVTSKKSAGEGRADAQNTVWGSRDVSFAFTDKTLAAVACMFCQ
jgi:hypothetical protein